MLASPKSPPVSVLFIVFFDIITNRGIGAKPYGFCNKLITTDFHYFVHRQDHGFSSFCVVKF